MNLSELNQRNTQIDGTDTFLLEEGIDVFFNGDLNLAWASTNTNTRNQVSNMVKNEYKVAALDNGNLIAVTRQSKVVRTEDSVATTGLGASDLEMPSGQEFLSHLKEKLNARSNEELAKALGVEESSLSFVENDRQVPSRFVIYVSLHTNLAPKELLCSLKL